MLIAIYTLTGQRDKHIDNLLAEELTKYGHKVVVRNYIQAARESITYEKPDVIIHPFPGGQYKYDFIQKCKEWGIEVIVRRGEAGIGRAQFEKLDDDTKTVILGYWDYSEYVDLELVWGQEFACLLADERPNLAGKIQACGAFAFDPYFREDCKRNTDHEKTILFATGFSACDCRSEYCETGLPEESGYHEALYNKHTEARETWIEAIKQLVEFFSDMFRFELKVRPGEMTTEYKMKLPDSVKIHPQVSSSSEVLKNIDILIHSGSTMAIEAHLLGIPSFNFCNVNPDPLMASVSPNISNYRELEWSVTQANVKQSNINMKALVELQKKLYGLIDGQACRRAAEYINEHIKHKTILTNIPNAWPKTADYHENKKTLRLKKRKGDFRWLCPCCRNVYFTRPKVELTKCPYCGMQIQKQDNNIAPVAPTRPRTESVLK